MKFVLLILSLVLISVAGNSQKVIHSEEYADPYLSGQVNIVLYDHVTADVLTLNELFRNMLKDHAFMTIEKRFPLAEKPRKMVTSSGERLADISRIYRIKLGEEASVPAVLSLIRKSGMAKFAEPHFLPAPCYVPNDDSIRVQYALTRINAFAAWDIQRGDSSVLIGVTDTGHEPFHPDLNANIQRNWADPVNGIDDDLDGYVDNFMGWDTGSNDNDPSVEESYHGIHVTGLCCAVTDNNTGMAGTGFNSRYMHVKIANSQGILTGAYEGLVYAADHGCKIVNCSWGGNQYSDINQEIIRYAAVNKNCLVVCGAGNNNNERLFYPASYEYAFSVASTNNQDSKPEFSNFGYAIDLVAPGDFVLSTWANGGYVFSGGTSMSAPVVAGAAALVSASFPQWNSRQLAEQLKISADIIDTLPINSVWEGKMGAGRLNMLRALTLGGRPAVVLNDVRASGTGAGLFLPGDTVELSGILVNYLAPATSVNLSLSAESAAVRLINPVRELGKMDYLQGVSINEEPFLIEISETAGINETVILKLEINADGYVRNQFIFLRVYGDFINVETSELKASFGSDGSAGITGQGFLRGNGFRLKNGGHLLYEGGLMIGASGRGVLDNIRGAAGDADELFTESVLTRKTSLPENLEEYKGRFGSEDINFKVSVDQRVIVSRLPQHRNFIITEYLLENQTDQLLEGVYAGMFCDWDLANAGSNRSGYQTNLRNGYVYSIPADTIYTSTQLLGNYPSNFYAIDNIPGGGGGLNLSDGFTDEEKYQSLSTMRSDAGAGPSGSDVITVLSSGPYLLQPGASIRLAFALHATSSLEALNQSAAESAYFYQQTALPLSVEDYSPKFIVYPNPAGQQFNLWFPDGVAASAPELFDLHGRKIDALFESIPGGWKIFQTQVSAGLILLKIYTARGWKYERVLIRGKD
jgi:serine protease